MDKIRREGEGTKGMVTVIVQRDQKTVRTSFTRESATNKRTGSHRNSSFHPSRSYEVKKQLASKGMISMLILCNLSDIQDPRYGPKGVPRCTLASTRSRLR